MAKRLFQQSLSDHCVGRSLSFEKVVAYSDIREQINNDIVIKPYSSKYKIYIVPDADMMRPVPKPQAADCDRKEETSDPA